MAPGCSPPSASSTRSVVPRSASFDIVAMGTTPYDITVYQPLLFAGRSLGHVVDELGRFLSSYDDDRYLELVR